jgi:aminomethyltransferase|tara:strand:+ start:1522 stop:2694 length:1173 start_codon:yes stop_codon:yes gene_type:complete
MNAKPACLTNTTKTVSDHHGDKTMTESYRTSALASRHKILGSDLEDWNGMGTAWSYHSDPNDEHDAVREAAGLFDMSPLKKVWVRGPDALQVIDFTITRDMTKVSPGQSVYTSVLTETGTMADDAIVANCGNNEYLYCHGSGNSMALLEAAAAGLDVTISLDDDLHNIAVQGPKALELLTPHCATDVAALGHFEHVETEIFGKQVRLSRTGYSGERGYEVFVCASDVGDMWDQLLEAGKDMGVMPCSFTALDKVRIEAALLFYGYDMTDEHTPWEVGLGFTVNKNKGDFRGKDAALASQSAPAFIGSGISSADELDLVGGESLLLDGEVVGTVNSPCYSHRLGKTFALVHLSAAANEAGTLLTVKGEDFEAQVVIESIPFFDPSKSRTHA